MNWKEILEQIFKFLRGQAEKSVAQPVKPVEVTIEPENKLKVYKLVRKSFRPDGIFSELFNEKGELIAHCLEHSYDNKPKVPNGKFTCQRGPHRLHGMTQDFITFEIEGIAGHDNILFHWGNYNKDSEGCVLVGKTHAQSPEGVHMVTASRDTFAKFMAALEGQNQFDLVVE